MMNPKVLPLETADDLYHYSDVVTGCYARILSESWIWSIGCSRTGVQFVGASLVVFLAG